MPCNFIVSFSFEYYVSRFQVSSKHTLFGGNSKVLFWLDADSVKESVGLRNYLSSPTVQTEVVG